MDRSWFGCTSKYATSASDGMVACEEGRGGEGREKGEEAGKSTVGGRVGEDGRCRDAMLSVCSFPFFFSLFFLLFFSAFFLAASERGNWEQGRVGLSCRAGFLLVLCSSAEGATWMTTIRQGKSTARKNNEQEEKKNDGRSNQDSPGKQTGLAAASRREKRARAPAKLTDRGKSAIRRRGEGARWAR